MSPSPQDTADGDGPPMLVGGNSAMHIALSDSKLPHIDDADVILPPTYYHMVKTLMDKINSKATISLPMLSRSPDYAVEIALRVAEIFGYIHNSKHFCYYSYILITFCPSSNWSIYHSEGSYITYFFFLSEERLFAFEMGNEPDHWIKKEKCYRNLTWVADDYFQEAKNLAIALRQAWPDDFPLHLQVRNEHHDFTV